jgi:hypothetical protein
MTDTTLFVAQIAGPAFIAIGIGFFVSRDHYRHVYQDLKKETLAVFMTAITVLAAGIVVVRMGNTWDTLPDVVVSLIGWAMIIKGLVLAIAPDFAERSALRVSRGNMYNLIGVVLLVVGIYLTAVAY